MERRQRRRRRGERKWESSPRRPEKGKSEETRVGCRMNRHTELTWHGKAGWCARDRRDRKTKRDGQRDRGREVLIS